MSGQIKLFLEELPIVSSLRSEAMRERHWERFRDEMGATKKVLDPDSEEFTLGKVRDMNMTN